MNCKILKEGIKNYHSNSFPLINILIRTSDRPNYFKNCIESIYKQTYKNFNIIIGIDNEESFNYVKEYNCKIIKYNFDDVVLPDRSNEYEYGTICIYNLYMNVLQKEVDQGYILYLDDDDKFNDNNALLKIANKIKEDADLIMYRAKFPKNRIIPSDKNFYNKPFPCDISTITFCFNSKIKPIWEGYGGADFRAATFLYEKFKNSIAYIDETLTTTQRNDLDGKGKKDDCIDIRTLPEFKYIQKLNNE
jgi:glycosyltransferase involved in cell wall biosynthesis